jgi:hypothetical protein
VTTNFLLLLRHFNNNTFQADGMLKQILHQKSNLKHTLFAGACNRSYPVKLINLRLRYKNIWIKNLLISNHIFFNIILVFDAYINWTFK